MTKRCSRCKQELPAVCFYKHKNGLNPSCKECLKIYQREYAARPEIAAQKKAKALAWRSRNIARTKQMNRKLYVSQHPLRLWKAAKERSVKKSIPFAISVQDIVIPEYCPVFGTPLKIGIGYGCPDSPSIDRVDPARGYLPDNVWVISWRANRIKSDATLSELELLISAMKRVGRAL